MSDRPRGVIIDETPPQEDSPRVKAIKSRARDAVLAGIAAATATTGIGLTLNAINTPHKADEPSQKPTPALVEPPRTPDPTPTPFLTTYSLAQQLEVTENNNPHLSMKDFFGKSKEEQEKIIESLVGKKTLLVLEDADSLKLNYDSDDEYGNRILVDIDSKEGVPVIFVTSPGGFDDLKKRSPNKDSDVNFEPGTRMLVMVMYDQHSNEPGIRLAPLQKLPPQQAQAASTKSP